MLIRSATFLLRVLIFASSPALASLSLSEREDIDVIATTPPTIELEIDFESRSSKISVRSRAFLSLELLGRALTDPELKNATFIVAGHTAFEGRGAYDQDLSEKRADAVKRFLVENFDFPPDRLVTVGYGNAKPRNGDPFAPDNQRVQIINLAPADQK